MAVDTSDQWIRFYQEKTFINYKFSLKCRKQYVNNS